ncbi:MAG: TerC family protein [Verrucomicrobia bacterium]|nr:TerC family protein [Verrucomicrobiota bacterium]
MLAALSDPQTWLSLVTLTVLEIVLGIDNIIFISILTGKLPPAQQPRARTVGLALALISRLLLLGTIYWLARLTQPFFRAFGQDFSGKDLVLISGGLFLIWKSVREIHEKIEGAEASEVQAQARATFGAVLFQIVLIDIVFSLDSVITAVGMARQIGVMMAAVVISVFIMLLAAGKISAFVNQHPTIKMLALSFLILIGVVLVADGFGQHFNKGYIYFAMAFAVGVEMLNLRVRSKSSPPSAEEP